MKKEKEEERAEGMGPQKRRKSMSGQKEEDGREEEERGESLGINRNRDKGQWQESKDSRRDGEMSGQKDGS